MRRNAEICPVSRSVVTPSARKQVFARIIAMFSSGAHDCTCQIGTEAHRGVRAYPQRDRSGSVFFGELLIRERGAQSLRACFIANPNVSNTHAPRGGPGVTALYDSILTVVTAS